MGCELRPMKRGPTEGDRVEHGSKALRDVARHQCLNLNHAKRSQQTNQMEKSRQASTCARCYNSWHWSSQRLTFSPRCRFGSCLPTFLIASWSFVIFSSSSTALRSEQNVEGSGRLSSTETNSDTEQPQQGAASSVLQPIGAGNVRTVL